MSSYRVLRDFTDSNENSNNHVYRKGDTYPYTSYAGAQTKDRLAQLLDTKGANDNFDGAIIEEVKDD